MLPNKHAVYSTYIPLTFLLFPGTDFLLGSLITPAAPGQADLRIAQIAIAVCTHATYMPAGLKFSKSFGSQNH